MMGWIWKLRLGPSPIHRGFTVTTMLSSIPNNSISIRTPGEILLAEKTQCQLEQIQPLSFNDLCRFWIAKEPQKVKGGWLAQTTGTLVKQPQTDSSCCPSSWAERQVVEVIDFKFIEYLLCQELLKSLW